ncbi:MAG: SEL1-like repeat protein [Synergistaceae bacterium]|nr:SEL1-like repeat protein [Synergistaceae bacterium]MBR0035024.1 SEL1-like repeat protein [Synergistaceae bacterium]
MGALADIIAEGITKFGGEIVAGILLMIALWMFPGLKRLFGRESDAERENRIKRELEIQHQKEEKLREELRRKDEALRQAEEQKAEEARRRAEIERELEEKQRAAGKPYQDVKYEHNKEWIAAVMVMIATLGLGWWMSLPDSAENQAGTETQVSTTENPTDPAAQNALAYKYYIAKDYEQAVVWYRKSAEQGNADGQFNLGFMYRNGYGVEQDYEQAVYWFRKAAEQGLARGQYNRGVMYENGYRVVKNLQEARKWYQLAADQGHESAKQALQCLN